MLDALFTPGGLRPETRRLPIGVAVAAVRGRDVSGAPRVWWLSRREVENFGSEAEAVAREAYGRATRAGDNLILVTPGQVMRHGANLIRGGKPRPDARPVTVSPDARRTNVTGAAEAKAPERSAPARANTGGGGQPANWLDRSPAAMAVGGVFARDVGKLAGLATGGWHAVKGLGETALFLDRLASPLDLLISPPGESALDQLSGAGRRVGDYAKKGIANPEGVVRDIRDKAQQLRIDLDPSATPVASTFSGELNRNFKIGQSQGEVAVGVGSLAVGGPLAGSVKEAAGLSKAASLEKSLAQGFSPAQAAYLAAPYPASGMGHHFVPRSFRLPPILGGGPLPRAISDGSFNRLAPEGITRGEFYQRHFQVDRDFHGTRLPARVGGGSWSGHKLGLEKNGLLGRLWDGSPAPMKARIGGLTAGAGSAAYDYSDEEP